jgi:hypothetical protein
VTVGARPRAHARLRERCPSCGLPAQRGQLICLSCGTRLALDRGRGDRRAVAAAAGALLLVAAVSLALVVTTLGGDEERKAARAAPAERAEPARNARVAAPVSAERALLKLKAKSNRQLAGAGVWPAGRDGWTVVLTSTADEAGAESYAQSVEKAGVDAGVLSTDDHPSLGSGLWFVFAGIYEDQLEAGEAAAELQASFPGAYVQLVQ